jgi:hypothetical protein
MDHSSGRWYDHPEIRKEFRNIKRWADYSMTLSRRRSSEVAVITSMESEFYIGAKSELSAQFNVAQTEHLCRAGAPFDRYLIEDLEEGSLPGYKVYVFMDCFYMSAKQREAVEKLKAEGNTLVWFFAPGFVTDNALSLKAMEQLAGITFTPNTKPFDAVRMDSGIFPESGESYSAWRNNFGEITHLSPRFIPADPECEVWGRYLDSSEPALVMKDNGEWRSVYSPTVPLHWSVLDKIYADAGVHIYAADGDNFTANEKWIGIHTVEGGIKNIRLKKPSPVYDVINNRLISENATDFEVELPAKTTALFVLDNPGK